MSLHVMSLLAVDAIRYKIEMENFNTMVVDHMVPVRFPRISCSFFPLGAWLFLSCLSPLSLLPPLPPPPSCFIHACLVLCGRIFFDFESSVFSLSEFLCSLRF